MVVDTMSFSGGGGDEEGRLLLYLRARDWVTQGYGDYGSSTHELRTFLFLQCTRLLALHIFHLLPLGIVGLFHVARSQRSFFVFAFSLPRRSVLDQHDLKFVWAYIAGKLRPFSVTVIVVVVIRTK
jgi:hypothetical protein